MPDNFFNIRFKAILLVITIIVFLSSIFLLLGIKHQKETMTHLIEDKKTMTMFAAQNIQEYIFKPYKKRIISLATTKKKVIAAFAKQDRKALKQSASLFYDTIKAENKFFYTMHFILPDGTSFLRMHRPDVYGDNISKIRPLVMLVHTRKKQMSGFEVGRLGLFYRIIQPVFFNKKYIGALGFGIHYEQLMENLKKNVSPNVAIAIKKTSWLKADLVVKEKKDIGDYFLLPMGSNIFKNIKKDIFTKDGLEQVQMGNKTYSIFSDIALKNHRHETIAKVFVALDISKEIRSTNRFILNVILLTLALLLIAALILYFSFGKLLTKIFDLNQSLSVNNLQLTKSKSYVDSIISSMSEGLLVTKPDGQITHANRAISQLTGYQIDNLKNKQLYDLFQQTNSLKDLCQQTKDTDKPAKSEQLLRTIEGRTIPVICSITNLSIEEHDFNRQVCIITDITNRKEAEKYFQRTHDELEHRVLERTHELAKSNQSLQLEMRERKRIEEDLRQSQKMEAIGTLAGGIAHDFNNILTAILGYTELAQNSADLKKIPTYLDEVLKAGLRAKNLIQHILTFGRHSEQKQQPIFIHTIIQESLNLLRASIPTTIEICQQIDPKCGSIMGDPTQIHQIVMNLCTNAYHAMQGSIGTLTVRLDEITIKDNLPSLPPGIYVQIEISDNGPGMDQNTMERIFEPYFTTKKSGKGTGLGLAVVHGIVKSHGGRITVKSIQGEGSCFTVLLPRCLDHSESQTTSSTNIALPTRGNEHLLVVDDEKKIAQLIHHMLTKFGYKITSMSDSTEALAWFRDNHHHIDMVITDMSMPKITGLSLAKQMLQLRPNIPIILCTGYSEGLNEEQAKELGISAFLLKPLDLKALAQTVRDTLDKR